MIGYSTLFWHVKNELESILLILCRPTMTYLLYFLLISLKTVVIMINMKKKTKQERNISGRVVLNVLLITFDCNQEPAAAEVKSVS